MYGYYVWLYYVWLICMVTNYVWLLTMYGYYGFLLRNPTVDSWFAKLHGICGHQLLPSQAEMGHEKDQGQGVAQDLTDRNVEDKNTVIARINNG